MTACCGEIRKTLKVKNALGLHLRPAGMIAQAACKYESEIFIDRADDHVDCRSALSLMMLSAGIGTELTFVARGGDAEAALNELEQLFADGFGEE